MNKIAVALYDQRSFKGFNFELHPVGFENLRYKCPDNNRKKYTNLVFSISPNYCTKYTTERERERERKESKIIFKWVKILEVIFKRSESMVGQCILFNAFIFAFKGVCLFFILMEHSEEKGGNQGV